MSMRLTLVCSLCLLIQGTGGAGELVTVQSNSTLTNIYLLKHNLQLALLGHPEIRLQWEGGEKTGLFAQVTVDPTSHGLAQGVTMTNAVGDLLTLHPMQNNSAEDLALAILEGYEKQLHAERIIRIALIPPAPRYPEADLHSGVDLVNRLTRILLADAGLSVVQLKDPLSEKIPPADRYLQVQIRLQDPGDRYQIVVGIFDSQRKPLGEVRLVRQVTEPASLVLDAEFYADLANQIAVKLGRPRLTNPEAVIARWELPCHLLSESIPYFQPTPRVSPPSPRTSPPVPPAGTPVPRAPQNINSPPSILNTPTAPPVLDPEFVALLEQKKWEDAGLQLNRWFEELVSRRHSTPGKARLSAEEYDRLALRLMQARLEAANRVPAEVKTLQALEAGLIRLSPRSMERFPEQNPQPHPADLQILKDYIDGTRTLFNHWQQASQQDSQHFDQFSEKTADYLRALIDADHGAQSRQQAYRDLALELAGKWLDSFESLPVADQHWHAPYRALLWVTVACNETQARTLEPLHRRLDHHQHPFLKLVGLRARQLGPWDRIRSDPRECIRRFQTFMDAAQALWKPESAADAFVLTEVVSHFANNTSHTQLKEMHEIQLEYAERLAPTGLLHQVAVTQLVHPWDEASARRSITLLRQHYANSNDRGVQSLIESLEERFPVLLDPARKAAAPEAHLLLDLESRDRQISLQYLTVRDNQAFGLLVGNQEQTELVKVDLKTGDLQSLATLQGAGTALILDSNSAYVATSRGVHQVDMSNGQAVEMMPQRSSSVTCLELAGGRLYAGTSAAELLAIDLASRQVEIVIGGMKSPSIQGDATFPVTITHVLYDAGRQRILVVSHITGSTQDLSRNAVWAWDLNGKTLDKLFTFGHLQGPGLWASLKDDTLLLANCWLLQYNLADGKYSLLANYQCGDLTPTHQGFMIAMTPIRAKGTIWWGGEKLSELQANGKDYTVHISPPFPKRVIYTDGRLQHYLTAVDEDQFLWYTHRQLYLVRPRD